MDAITIKTTTTVVDLTGLACLRGGVAVLSKLGPWVTELRLKGCAGLAGDLAAFAPLVRLVVLDLGGVTQLEGSLASLAGLKKLRVLDLQGDPVSRSHAVAGAFADATELPELTHLNLNFCSLVRGDLEDLVGLLSLTFLGISSTAAIGDCHALAHLPLASLEIFDCPQVHGVGGFKQQRPECRVYGRK